MKFNSKFMMIFFQFLSLLKKLILINAIESALLSFDDCWVIQMDW